MLTIHANAQDMAPLHHDNLHSSVAASTDGKQPQSMAPTKRDDGWLRVKDLSDAEDDEGAFYDLPRRGIWTVGRRRQSDIVLSPSASKASRHHLTLEWDEQGGVVIDKSFHGTSIVRTRAHSEIINLRKGSRTQLHPGDCIRIGQLAIRIMLPCWAPSTTHTERYIVEHIQSEPSIRIDNHEIVLASEKTKKAFIKAARFANSDDPIFISGETGTGKELMAIMIHHCSSRSTGPFVAVNCASLNSPLQDTKLFGQVKGAYTGATDSKQGLLEEADGGTLFLDEIAELTTATQTKFLRVVQDGMLRREGGLKDKHVNVRFITATNKSLNTLRKLDLFRDDFFYRLCTLDISLPPLREREADIRFLTHKFMAESAHANQDISISPSGMNRILDEQWCGNIRELKAFIRLLVKTAPAKKQCNTSDIEAVLKIFYREDPPAPTPKEIVCEPASNPKANWYREKIKSGASQTDMAIDLGVTKQAVSKDIKKLRDRGEI